MFNLLQKILIWIHSYPIILELFQIAESLSIILALLIALKTYDSQVRQEKFNNSFSLIEIFTKNVQDADFLILKSVFQNTYESCGANSGCFVTFFNNQVEQHYVADLFLEEGNGLLVRGNLEDIPRQNLQYNQQDQRIELGSVRLIAEQLNVIAYEVFKGQIEIRIVYYNLGEVILVTCSLLDIAIQADKDKIYNLTERFKYLLKIRDNLSFKALPKISFAELC